MPKFNLLDKVTIKCHSDPNHNGKTGTICGGYQVERDSRPLDWEKIIPGQDMWDQFNPHQLNIYVVCVDDEKVGCKEEWLEITQ